MKTLARAAGARSRLALPSATLLLLVPLLASPVVAQTPPPAEPSGAPARQANEDPLGRSTPYGAVMGFLRTAQREDYAQAAQYLDTRARAAAAEELARQLRTVLDRGLIADLDVVSRAPEGNLQDGLPPERERVGSVDTRSGRLEVVLVRVDRGAQGQIWLFAPDTLARVPAAAEERGTFDPESFLPRPLVEITVLSLPLYRWIGMALLLFLAFAFGSIVTRAIVPLLRPVLRRLTGEQDERALILLKGPTRMVLIALAIRLFSVLGLTLAMRQFWTRVAVVVAIIGVAWFLIRLTDVVSALVSTRLSRRQRIGRIAVMALVARLFKATVVIAGALALLGRAGADLTAVLTGLGIGGVGVALAAQKTLENLFGGIMIISDEPVRVGDFCRVGDVIGTVEDIGIRSTRVRTLARTVVSIPNGQLAQMNVENFALRDKFWLRHVVGLRYETTADQLRYVLAEVRAMLYAHPKIEQDGARVRFVSFGGSSLDLEIFAYAWAADWSAFLGVQEDVLLRIMDVIAKAGTSVAFPSQTTYLARDRAMDAERTAEAEGQVRAWRDRGDLPFPDFRPEEIGHLRATAEYPPAGSALRSEAQGV